MTEVCNGVDDNCNQKVDEGCPTGGGSVAFGAPTTASPVFGDPGGSGFDDTCPAGEVLVGLTGVTDAYLRQIQGICGKLTVVENKSASPYTYAVAIASGTTLPNHGTFSGTKNTIKCPTDTVAVGAQGRGGALVDQLVLRCAALTVMKTSTAFAIQVSSTIVLTDTLGGTGGSPISPFTCSNDRIMNRIGGSAGDGLDTTKFTCATATVPLR